MLVVDHGQLEVPRGRGTSGRTATGAVGTADEVGHEEADVLLGLEVVPIAVARQGQHQLVGPIDRVNRLFDLSMVQELLGGLTQLERLFLHQLRLARQLFDEVLSVQRLPAP